MERSYLPHVIAALSILFLLVGCAKQYTLPSTSAGRACVDDANRERQSCLALAESVRQQCLEEQRKIAQRELRRATDDYRHERQRADQEYDRAQNEYYRQNDRYIACESRNKRKSIEWDNAVERWWRDRDRDRLPQPPVPLYEDCGEEPRKPSRPNIDRPSLKDFVDEDYCSNSWSRAKKRCTKEYDAVFVNRCDGTID